MQKLLGISYLCDICIFMYKGKIKVRRDKFRPWKTLTCDEDTRTQLRELSSILRIGMREILTRLVDVEFKKIKRKDIVNE